MFVRMLQLKVKPGTLVRLRDFYDYAVIPELRQMPGCRFAGLVQSCRQADEFISTSIWDSKAHAQTFEKSTIFKTLRSQLNEFLAESTEWKIQLSEDLELHYTPVPQEPVLSEYTIKEKSAAAPPPDDKKQRLYVRIVSVKLQPGREQEFHEIYNKEILPALDTMPGYRYGYLIESLQNKDDVISVTVWDSHKDAERYEKEGHFAGLVDRVKQTFSGFTQWKMALEKDFSGLLKSSADLRVNHYQMVTGRSF